MTSGSVAVAGGTPSTALALARSGRHVTLVLADGLSDTDAAACRGGGIAVEHAPEQHVRVTSRWLQEGYQLYRAVLDRPYDTLVFDGNAAAAYSVARAKETASALDDTALVVRLGTPLLRRLAHQPFVTHNDLGTAVTERHVVGLADVLICEPETHSWLREQDWALPDHIVEVADPHTGLVEAIASPARPKRPTAGDPLVSVVIPVYERTRYLPLCLETLARQDYARLEVVVADDGSTAPEVTTYLGELERGTWPWPLRVVRLPHGGLASARNGGWQAASGDLVLFLDDDDAAFDDLVARVVRARVAAGADVVVAGARTFEGDGRPEPRGGDRVTISLCDPGELTLLGNHSGGPTCLWTRAWLERLGGFSATPPVVEDWHILVRASLAGARITTPPDPAWWYRRTPTSMFSADPHGALDAALPAMSALLAESLPPHARLLPQLVAGAYRELERAGQAKDAPPGGTRSSARRVAARLRRLR